MDSSGPIRILYMEDDPGLARLIQKRLQPLGYVVDTAPDGEKGLAMVASTAYDVLILDQVMPVHDGLDVIRILLARNALPPTIMVTGTGSEKVAVEAMKLGAGDYLVKDVDGGYIELLPSVIENVLRQQRAAKEKQRMEAALRESEERFRQTVEHAPFGYFRLGKDGLWQYVNAAWERMHGYSRSEVIGKSFEITQTEESKSQARANVQRALAGETITGEFSRRRKDGEVEYHLFNIQPVRDRGEIVAVEGFINDTTEQRRLEEQVRRAHRMESVGILAAGVAHHFNNILAAISGNAEWVKVVIGDSHEATEFLDKILESVKRAAGLTQQLLSVERGEWGERYETSVADLIADVTAAMTPLCNRRIQVRSHVAEHLPHLYLNRKEIGKAIENICLNARDAMPNGGDLTIKAELAELPAEVRTAHVNVRPGSFVIISISDTGTGMDRETLGKVFDPFFTTKGPGKGVGLGLPTAYWTVVSHGGCIDADSEPGKGSVFRVYLPVVPPPHPS